MAESFDVTKKQKHGLKHGYFQMPTTTALGETNKFPKTTHAKDPESGKPVTEPRNFYAKKGKTGQNDDAYIGADNREFKKIMPEANAGIYKASVSYTTTNDPYKPSYGAGLRTLMKNGHQIMGKHEQNFVPAKNETHVKKGKGMCYEYMENPPPKRRATKDEEGIVILEPRNFTTVPMKTGVMDGKKDKRGPTFGGKIEYIPSDYNIEKKMLKE